MQWPPRFVSPKMNLSEPSSLFILVDRFSSLKSITIVLISIHVLLNLQYRPFLKYQFGNLKSQYQIQAVVDLTSVTHNDLQ